MPREVTWILDLTIGLQIRTSEGAQGRKRDEPIGVRVVDAVWPVVLVWRWVAWRWTGERPGEGRHQSCRWPIVLVCSLNCEALGAQET